MSLPLVVIAAFRLHDSHALFLLALAARTCLPTRTLPASSNLKVRHRRQPLATTKPVQWVGGRRGGAILLMMRHPSGVCDAQIGNGKRAWLGDDGTPSELPTGQDIRTSVELQGSLLPHLQPVFPLSPPSTNSLHQPTSTMHFSLASFASAAVLLTGLTSALPASIPSPDLRIRDAGPTGTLLSPAGDAGFLVGDLIPFKYQRTISEEATTSSLNVTLITYDGRVTYHAVRHSRS